MLKRDTKVGLFLLIVVTIPLCYGSVRLGIGTTSNLGPGFIPFVAGLILALLSIAMIVSSISIKKTERERHQENPVLITPGVFWIMVPLILFGFFIENIGFFICAFVVSILMLRINGVKKWSVIIFSSLLTCIAIFLFFNLLLQARLPLGILQFGG